MSRLHFLEETGSHFQDQIHSGCKFCSKTGQKQIRQFCVQHTPGRAVQPYSYLQKLEIPSQLQVVPGCGKTEPSEVSDLDKKNIREKILGSKLFESLQVLIFKQFCENSLPQSEKTHLGSDFENWS